MTRRFTLNVCLTLALTLCGCSGVVEPDSTPVQTAAGKANIKIALEDIAKSGTTGSAVMSVSSGIDMLPPEDSALADGLRMDVQELEGLKGSAKIKAKAQEMLKKIE